MVLLKASFSYACQFFSITFAFGLCYGINPCYAVMRALLCTTFFDIDNKKYLSNKLAYDF